MSRMLRQARYANPQATARRLAREIGMGPEELKEYLRHRYGVGSLGYAYTFAKKMEPGHPIRPRYHVGDLLTGPFSGVGEVISASYDDYAPTYRVRTERGVIHSVNEDQPLYLVGSKSRDATRPRPRLRSSKARAKIARVMREYSEGKLYSSSGRKVRSHRQAVAIALSEARRAGYKIPGRKGKAARDASHKGGKRKGARDATRDVDTSFVRKHWTKIRGYYLLIGPYSEFGHLTTDHRRRIFAKTRSAETAEKFRRMGFRSLEGAWKLFRNRLSDFDVY